VSLLGRLAAANIVLVLFNLAPAFPMDGGRILNALLAMRMDSGKALLIAARVGQAMAFVFGFLGLAVGNPLLMLVAVFVYVSAAAEAQASSVEGMTTGLSVADAMETRFAVIPVEATLGEAVNVLLATPQYEFPVVDAFSKPVGLLTRDGLIVALRASGPDASVTDALLTAAPSVRLRDKLDFGIREMNRLGAPAISVVDGEGALVGPADDAERRRNADDPRGAAGLAVSSTELSPTASGVRGRKRIKRIGKPPKHRLNLVEAPSWRPSGG
jgi:CBS domain-containing protein